MDVAAKSECSTQTENVSSSVVGCDLGNLPKILQFAHGFSWSLCPGCPASEFSGRFEMNGFAYAGASEDGDPIG